MLTTCEVKIENDYYEFKLSKILFVKNININIK